MRGGCKNKKRQVQVAMKKIEEFLIINFGLFLVAFGIYLFKVPNNFATGGVSGLAIVFSHFYPWITVGPFMLIINTLLLIASFFFVGSNFGSKTVYSSYALSGMVWFLEKVFPLYGPITGETMLELVFAILLPGIGSAIVFNQNASTGGTDIVARILSKYMHIHIGKTLLMADFFITLTATAAFGIKIGMYSILGLFMKGFLIDIVIEGMNVSKLIVIVSSKPEEVKHFIVSELKRGATVHKAKGAFTEEEKEVITTIVSRRQAVRLKEYISKIDKRAFLSVSNTSEIMGKGFRNVEL